MKSTIVSIALAVLSSQRVVAVELRCEAENNYLLEVKEGPDTFSVTIQDLGTHEIAKSLNLPGANQEYAYVTAAFDVPKSQCRFSATNSLIFYCGDHNTSVDLSWPEAHLNLNWVNVGMTKITEESVLNGTSTFYQLSFSMHERSSARQLSEVFTFNIDACAQN